MQRLTARQEAEAIEQFGDDLAAILIALDKLTGGMSVEAVEAVNAIPHQDYLDTIAEAFRAAGDRLLRAVDGVAE